MGANQSLRPADATPASRRLHPSGTGAAEPDPDASTSPGGSLAPRGPHTVPVRPRAPCRGGRGRNHCLQPRLRPVHPRARRTATGAAPPLLRPISPIRFPAVAPQIRRLHMTLSTAGSIASLAALVPLAITGAATILQRVGGRRLLRLRPGPVDVVTTTSDDSSSPRGPMVRRVTTGHGQVQGLAYCAQSIGRFYRKSHIRVFMSKQVATRLANHLVILGGLRGNEIAEEFVAQLNARHGGLIEFDDTPDVMSIAIPGWNAAGYDLAIDTHGYIRRDLALVVVWRNPLAGPEWRRAIMCVGFTSYGTAEAARWVFAQVVPSSARALFSSQDASMRSFRRGLRQKKCCLAVIEMSYRASPVPSAIGEPVIRHVDCIDLPVDIPMSSIPPVTT